MKIHVTNADWNLAPSVQISQSQMHPGHHDHQLMSHHTQKQDVESTSGNFMGNWKKCSAYLYMITHILTYHTLMKLIQYKCVVWFSLMNIILCNFSNFDIYPKQMGAEASAHSSMRVAHLQCVSRTQCKISLRNSNVQLHAVKFKVNIVNICF